MTKIEQTHSQLNTACSSKAEKKTEEKDYSIFKPLITGGTIGGSALLLSNELAATVAQNEIKKSVGLIPVDKIDNIFKNSNFAATGGEFVNPSGGNFAISLQETILDIKYQNSKKSFAKKLSYKMKKRSLKNKAKSIEKYSGGLNAGYVAKRHKILINKENAGALLFHEMGHAQNHTTKGIGNLFAKYRKSKIPTTLILAGLASALLPRYEGEEAETIKGKVCNFLRDNCAQITGLGAIATPLEEGMASLNGRKIAKNTLTKQQFKTINKLNAKAWLTYVTVAAGLVLTTALVSKFNDKYNNAA